MHGGNAFLLIFVVLLVLNVPTFIGAAPWDEVFPVPVSEIEAILHHPVGAASHLRVDPDAVRSWLRVFPFGPPVANRTGSLGLGVPGSHLYR